MITPNSHCLRGLAKENGHSKSRGTFQFHSESRDPSPFFSGNHQARGNRPRKTKRWLQRMDKESTPGKVQKLSGRKSSSRDSVASPLFSSHRGGRIEQSNSGCQPRDMFLEKNRVPLSNSPVGCGLNKIRCLSERHENQYQNKGLFQHHASSAQTHQDV